MLELLLVLNDRGDGETLPVEGEAVFPHVVVRKSLNEVEPKHRWHATQNKKHSSILFHSDLLYICVLTKIKKANYYFLYQDR